MTEAEHAALKKKQPDLPDGKPYEVRAGNKMVELHVDDNEVFESYSKGEPMGGKPSVFADFTAQCDYGHDPAVCKCHLPLWHSGQDESIFKAFQRSKTQWVVGGVCGLRKKTDGPGEMVSAFQDRHRGFGFPVTNDELKRFNARRRATNPELPELLESPGVRFLVYGGTDKKEGWWGWENFEEQLKDYIDLFEFLHPKHQLQIETDWSAGHSKHREGALNAIPMNTGFGGSQPLMRCSLIEREEIMEMVIFPLQFEMSN